MTPPTPADGPSEPDDPALDRRLDAERAGAAYWRDVAQERRLEAARVQHRPLVRAAIAVDRRTRPVQDRLARLAGRAAAAGARLDLVARGLGTNRRDRGSSIDHDRPPAEPRDPRSVLVVALGPPPGLARADVEVAAVDRADVDERVAASAAAVVVLVGPETVPRSPSWIDELVAAVDGPIVAAVPLVVHPRRPLARRTPHDGRVRALGGRLAEAEGRPVLRAAEAGRPVDAGTIPDGPGPAVDTGTGAALVVDRAVWDAAGGLGEADDLDAAVADLSLRLRGGGGTIVAVPSVVVEDGRDVARRQDLDHVVAPDSEAWRHLVEDHGATLLRRGGGPAPVPTWTVTTATPSPKMAAHSGDWHFAGLFTDVLERAGYRARRQTIAEVDSLGGRASDVHVVLRGLEPVRRTPGQAHVLWLISHPEALDVAECDAADLVVVASAAYAAHLRTLTRTPVEVLLQATDPGHFHPRPPVEAHRHPITVVANTRDVRRRAVADALDAGHPPTIYGLGWDRLVEPSLVAGDYVAFADLPVVYSSAGLVLNDHWDTMRHWGFVSNRILDVAACGVPVVSDHLTEITDLFGDLVPTWSTVDELGRILDEAAAHPERFAERAVEARRVVLDGHTFDHRVDELGALLVRHGLLPEPDQR